MNMMISYQELVRTFLKVTVIVCYSDKKRSAVVAGEKNTSQFNLK